MSLQIALQQWLPQHQLDFYCIFLLSLTCILIFSLLLLAYFSPRRTRTLLPPSPPSLPVIGNLHQLGTLPHRSLRELARKYGPLMHLRLGRVPTLVVSSAESAREVRKTHDLVFASRPRMSTVTRLIFGKDLAFSPYGEYWRQIRRISVLHLLSTKQVQSYRTVRQEEVASMVEKIKTSSSCSSTINLSEMLVTLTNDVTCRIVLGKKYSAGEEEEQNSGARKFRGLLGEFLALLGAFPMKDFIPSLAWVDRVSGLDGRVERNFREWDGFLEQVVEEHLLAMEEEEEEADHGYTNFVDLLLALEKNQSLRISLDRDGVKALILDMFAAGTDTTSTTIDWTMAELIRHPRVMKKVQEEVRGIMGEKASMVNEEDTDKMSYLRSVIKENLRLHPPIPLQLGESITSAEVQGYVIPEKTRVIINAWAIGREPSMWERPEEFWPERFDNDNYDDNPIDFKGQHFQLIPFGAGRRGCPGIPFAIPIIELALANLLYHFNWELPDGGRGEDLDISEVSGLTTHRTSNLLLVASPLFLA